MTQLEEDEFLIAQPTKFDWAVRDLARLSGIRHDRLRRYLLKRGDIEKFQRFMLLSQLVDGNTHPLWRMILRRFGFSVSEPDATGRNRTQPDASH
jgi:hypothetical protein